MTKTNSGEASQKQSRKCSQDIPRNSNQAGESQVSGWYSKTTACFGKPNAPEFEGFQLDAIFEQNGIISVQRRNSTIWSRKEIIMLQLLLKKKDGENARQCAKKTQRQEIGRIQGHTHQLMQNKKLV